MGEKNEETTVWMEATADNFSVHKSVSEPLKAAGCFLDRIAGHCLDIPFGNVPAREEELEEQDAVSVFCHQSFWW